MRKHSFYCAICLAWKPLAEIVTSECCKGNLCGDCFVQSVKYQINNGMAYNITCVFSECGKRVSSEYLQARLPDTIWEKYRTLIQYDQNLIESPYCRYCPIPTCVTPVLWDTTNSKIQCIKPECSFEFCAHCFLTWEGHEGLSCDQHRENLVIGNKLDFSCLVNQSYLHSLGAQPCPNCGIYVLKDEGCNSVTCTGCKHIFCCK
jgi:hypothetical protein